MKLEVIRFQVGIELVFILSLRSIVFRSIDIKSLQSKYHMDLKFSHIKQKNSS